MWQKKSALLSVALFVASTGAAAAQEVVAKIPFPFVVNGRTLPAGEYVVSPLDDRGDVILIHGTHTNHKAVEVVETRPATGQDPAGKQPALTFTHSGSQYQLATIWESPVEGLALPKH